MNIGSVNGQLLRNYSFFKSNYLKQSTGVKNYNHIEILKEKIISSNIENSNYLKLGNTSVEISQLQTLFKNLGYFNKNVSGYYGKETKDAVKKFQKGFGIKETGIIDAATKVAIAKSRDDGQSSEQSTVAMRMKNLEGNIAVKHDFTIDGEYGLGTAETINGFQRSYSSVKDKRGNAETLRKINIICNRLKLQENWATELDNSMVFTYENKSNQLEKHQKKLKELGFYKANIDGKYGNCTYTAICDFQASKQLVEDGILGPETLYALNKAC